ncbi:MAG: class I SAM-dependent rRNA methyltransferase [Acidimicrobiales bacterium]
MPVLDLPTLTPPAERRLAVRVTPDAERQLRGGHPWVFDRSITHTSHQGAPGDLAVVFDRRRDFLAIGLWDPTSPIRVRVLHRGAPTPIDASWWAAAVDRAVAHRRPLIDSADTDAYRLIHGENDGLPGLVVDQYRSVLVVKLYSPAWFGHLQSVLPLVAERSGAGQIVLRWARTVDRHSPGSLHDGATIMGPRVEGTSEFSENDLRFGADLARGHKTGHFLDQRDNRRRVAALARGASVLDVFSCTGGFGLNAAAGGATSVRFVDVNRHALDEATANVARNAEIAEVGQCRVHTSAGDAFSVMEELAAGSARFDLLIVDPPSFANRAADVEKALHAYRRLAALGAGLLTPGGWLVQASCSSRVNGVQLEAAVRAGAAAAARSLGDVSGHGHPLDHPIGFAQGAYLDAIFARVE